MISSKDMPDSFLRARLREPALRQPGVSSASGMARVAPQMPVNAPEPVLDPSVPQNASTVKIEAFIACEIPVGQAQQKGACVIQGKIRFFTKAKIKEAERQWRAILGPMVPEKPLEGALNLCVTLHFPWRKVDKKAQKQFKVMPIPTRPDCSNLIKLLEDQMTKLGFWKDDSQIAELTIRKFRSDMPGIHFTIQPSQPTPR